MSTGTLRLPARAANKTKTRQSHSIASLRRPITIGLGCGIPVLSLSLSHQGGELLLAERWLLGGASLILCGVVLALSLSHLAAAIRDITQSATWQAWCLAIAVDSALVVAELVRVSGEAGMVQWGMMTALTGASAILNCWGFFRHGIARRGAER